VEKTLDRVTSVLVALLLTVMTVVILTSVVTRYILGDPISWGEQVAKYLMVWAAFLAASLGIKQGSHVAVNIFVDLLPASPRKFLGYVGLVLTAAFLAVVVYQGIFFTLKVSSHSDPLVGEMSMAYPYAAIPVGAFLMLVQLLLLALKIRSGGKLSETTSLA
jgi:TRAP-type C4-dicarboxylate transport system permease small subunit